MLSNIDLARELYRALGERDVGALLSLLDPSFTAEVSEGMPLGVGGAIAGPEAMLRDVWGRIATSFEVTPEPSELVPAEPDRVFAIGRYRGRARGGGEVDARFVHVLRFRQGRLVFLEQVTDTARWVEAKEGGRDAP